MKRNQMGLVSSLGTSLLIVINCVVACGGSSSSNGSTAGGAGKGSAGASADAGAANGGDAGSSDAPGKAGSGPSGDAGENGSEAGSSSGGAAGEAGAAGMECTPATFEQDCPQKACNLVSGCLEGSCQYTPVAVCVNRAAIGTFAPGAADVTVGNVTLHGTLGAFRVSDGTVCKAATCVTGGIVP